MDALEKPIRRDFPANTLCFCLVVNRSAHGGELKSDADVVEKTSGLLRIGATLRFSRYKIL